MEEQLSAKIYRHIQQDILSHAIDEQTFLTENELAQKYQVSKAPVRDALHLLCAQGYLTSFPRKGYLVRRYSRAEVRKIQQVRTHLEKLAVTLAVRQASEEDILSLGAYLQDPQSRPETDPENASNSAFHMRLAEISGNEYIVSILRDLLHKICIVWIGEDFDVASHQAIIDALLQRDEAKALAALERDLNHG